MYGLLFVMVCPCFLLPTSLSVTLILALHAPALSSSEQPKPQTTPPLFLPQDLGTCYPHCLECSFLGSAPGQLHTLTQRCLKNPRDGEAWWAAVYGVAQSRTFPRLVPVISGRSKGASELVQCHVSQVSMRVARGSASWLSSHGRGLGR